MPIDRGIIGTALCAAFLGAACAGSSEPAGEADLVVLAGTLIDGTGAAPLRDVAVVVRDGAIVSIEPIGETPPAAGRVIDARDGWVMPGLADAHVHFSTGGLLTTDSAAADRLLRQFLYYGVTTVLNVGATFGTGAHIDALRARIEAGELPGPTILAARGLITVSGSHPIGTIMFAPEGTDAASFDWSRRGVYVVDSPQAMRATVDRFAAGGADAIKIVIESGPPPFGDHHPQMPPELVAAAVQAAAAHGLPVLAHVSTPDELDVALDAGVHAAMHLVWQPPPSAATLARMREAGTWYVPTMSVFVWPDVWGAPEDQLTDPFLRAGVDPVAIESLLDSPLLPRERATPADLERRAAAIAALGAAHRAGVRIVAGSDVGNPTVFPGHSMHHELALMVEAGMTPMEAIVDATSALASMLDDDSFGTIAPGRRADLLVLDADPLADIMNTRAIRAVVARGRVVDRDALLGPRPGEEGRTR